MSLHSVQDRAAYENVDVGAIANPSLNHIFQDPKGKAMQWTDVQACL